ncbi:hypothetical protein [Diatraea saccharalis granulovirus]|uniref:Uncharacterized protein n=1 Tax=Diatraea saccharalis granulovirus TaxID=1675862 RepID=A0A0R7EYP9_9BBAC|nr:hypothetical protein [Diatraea saccharalis granulovirus]AKN80703.1 hypothetical protein [Diatraea saccharalis granulovirus]
MFQISRARTNNDVDIIFQISNTLNSVSQYSFKLLNAPRATKTRPVSGLDPNKPINCVFSYESPSNDDYVLSMFRTQQLLPDIINHIKVNIVKVISRTHQEWWYVFGMKRGHELPATVGIKKILVRNQEYEKNLCSISGHVPADLLKMLNHRTNNINNLHGLCITAPIPDINNSPVVLIREDSNSTAALK